MCDTNWCTFCDSAISPYSNSLYCSEDCLRQDALTHHPMLGYDFQELKSFPKQQERMPSYVRRKSSIPSLSTVDNTIQIQRMPSLSPSLSSSISSYSSMNEAPYICQPKPRKSSASIPFMEQLNQALMSL